MAGISSLSRQLEQLMKTSADKDKIIADITAKNEDLRSQVVLVTTSQQNLQAEITAKFALIEKRLLAIES